LLPPPGGKGPEIQGEPVVNSTGAVPLERLEIFTDWMKRMLARDDLHGLTDDLLIYGMP